MISSSFISSVNSIAALYPFAHSGLSPLAVFPPADFYTYLVGTLYSHHVVVNP